MNLSTCVSSQPLMRPCCCPSTHRCLSLILSYRAYGKLHRISNTMQSISVCIPFQLWFSHMITDSPRSHARTGTKILITILSRSRAASSCRGS
jgi:hypothetical protein